MRNEARPLVPEKPNARLGPKLSFSSFQVDIHE